MSNDQNNSENPRLTAIFTQLEERALEERALDIGEIKREIRILHESGVDLNKPSRSGCTLATLAAEEGLVSIIEALAEAGVDLDKPDEHGWTPGTRAGVEGHEKVLEALVKAGADPRKPDENGNTPEGFIAMHLARRSNIQRAANRICESLRRELTPVATVGAPPPSL